MSKSAKRSREEVDSDDYVTSDDNLDAFTDIGSEEDSEESEENGGEMIGRSDDDSEGGEENDGEMNLVSDEDSEEGEENGGEMIGGSDDDSEESEENNGEMHVVSDEDSEEGEENDGEMHEGLDEDSEEGKDNDLVYGEMEELEKEYTNLRHQEQDVLANLRQQKGEDNLKGVAVKNQKASPYRHKATLWNKSLELRFLLQKPFSSSNKLPQESVRSIFIESDEGVSEAYSELISSSEKTIASLLELQNDGLMSSDVSLLSSGNSQSSKKHEHEDIDSETDNKWKLISQMHSRMASFRDKSIDKWQRKTQVTTGAASIKGRFQAFNQNISQQVAASMRDPSRLIKQMQARRSTISIFGSVPDEIVNIKEEGADGNPDLLDDVELYQQLLKEFFETFDPSATEAALYNFKRSQAKKRKIVDRRASKSRKIRYNVHEKIVNFMAPEPANIPPMASKLFKNLFSLESKTPAST
ncbi:hypothetical protein QQ045_005261 [Rhodiola kirilowii]